MVTTVDSISDTPGPVAYLRNTVPYYGLHLIHIHISFYELTVTCLNLVDTEFFDVIQST